MSAVGEPVYPADSADDVGEETRFLRDPFAPEELGRGHEEEAVDFTRALFAAGATPGEARAAVAE
eukprot:7083245-Alexandrium_andersonii.AAC.1